MPRSHPVDEDYPPILCDKCHQELREIVHVAVQIPVGWQNLTKIGLRSRRVVVHGVDWIPRQISCGCGIRGHVDAPPATGPVSQTRMTLTQWRRRQKKEYRRNYYGKARKKAKDGSAQEET